MTLTRKRVIISTTKTKKKNKQAKERLIKMKKYNRSEIFKRAWAIKKSENTTMSIALKRAWAEAKNPVMTVADKEAVWENLVNGIAKVELTGTAKQVSWAEEIRAKAIKALVFGGKSMVGRETDYLMSKYEKATRYLLTKKADSKFWIDNRGCSSFAEIAFIELQQTWEDDKEWEADIDDEELEEEIISQMRRTFDYSDNKAHYIFTMQRYANRNNNAEISVREWSVYGKSRAFFTIDGKDYGYYDNISGKYVAGKNSVDNL